MSPDHIAEIALIEVSRMQREALDALFADADDPIPEDDGALAALADFLAEEVA